MPDTSAVTGFQDSALDVYTVVPGVNQGIVTGKIYTCTTSTTGPTNPTNGVNAASCATATQARLDAQTAYLALAAMPDSGLPVAANLAGLTLAPGVYKAPSGSFLIEGGDLTLDAQGDANAVFVFQMATTLTVGGPGAAAPQSVKLINGALAKNVFCQVGSAAHIILQDRLFKIKKLTRTSGTLDFLAPADPVRPVVLEQDSGAYGGARVVR